MIRTVVDTPARLEHLVRTLDVAPVVALDTETVGHDIRKEHPYGLARALSIQFAVPHESFFVPLWGEKLAWLEALRPFLEDPTPKKIAHNAKYDWHVLANHGVAIKGLHCDTLVASFLHDNGRRGHGLKALCNDWLGLACPDFKETFARPVTLKNGKPGKRLELPDLALVAENDTGRLVDYAIRDPELTLKLYHYVCPKLMATEWFSGHSLWDYYQEFERPFTEVLVATERRGVPLARGRLLEIGRSVSQERGRVLENLEHELFALGVDPLEFNPGSGPQLAALLYTRLGAPVPKATPKGAPCTDDETLELVAKSLPVGARLIRLVLELRRLRKIATTYVGPLLSTCDRYGGRVHTSFHQTGTATMRLSSSNPNLQNIPVRTPLGKQLRSAFVAQEGCVLGDIDLSQIEVRVAAHISGDNALCQTYREGWDIYSRTAAGVDPEARKWVGDRPLTRELVKEVKARFPEARQRAKTLVLGTLYGMGPGRYAAQTGASMDDALGAIRNFFRLYPGLQKHIGQVKEECYKKGYVKTILGRRCHIPEIRHENDALRAYAERQAFNYVIQGSAADLVKMAMLAIEKDDRLREMGVTMIAQVHDELLFQIPKGSEEEARSRIEERVSKPYLFHGCGALRVETPASLGFGPSWAEAKEE